jgi:GAF domain-containing protein
MRSLGTQTSSHCADSGKSESSWTEQERLEALHAYDIIDSLPETAFDDIAGIAAHSCGAPIAVINFIDRDRQWFKAEIGLGVRETPLDVSICRHAMLQKGLFVVSDTLADPRFAVTLS